MFWRRKKARKKKAVEERRKEPRLEDSSEIAIEYEDLESPGGGKRIYTTRARDASPGGMKIHSEIPFPPSTGLEIRLKSRRTGKSIEVHGRVKWMRRQKPEGLYEIGIEFIETPIRSIMDLLEHIYKG